MRRVWRYLAGLLLAVTAVLVCPTYIFHSSGHAGYEDCFASWNYDSITLFGWPIRQNQQVSHAGTPALRNLQKTCPHTPVVGGGRSRNLLGATEFRDGRFPLGVQMVRRVEQPSGMARIVNELVCGEWSAPPEQSKLGNRSDRSPRRDRLVHSAGYWQRLRGYLWQG
jgi:hypothetical protein